MSDYKIAIKIAGQLQNSFTSAIKGAQAGISGLGVSGKAGSLAMKGIGVAAKATAATLVAAGAAIAGVGAYSVKVGKDFESQMSTVQSISGATGAEFEALKAKAQEMGATTSFSATEAGQAMEYMAMAGWKSQDMIGGIGGIMNLAAASGEDLAMTSDIVTDALTAFGLSAKDSGHFADIMAAASSNANTNVSMLGESFKYAAPVAGSLGISAEDTSIALGLMANAGIKASSAGTALRTGLTNLAKPTKQMQSYMSRYNIAMVKNKDGSVNLRDTMVDLREKMSGMSQTEQAAAAAAIFGKNSMAGWLAIINSSDKDFEKLTQSIDGCNGAAAEMAAMKLDNLEGDITLLKSAMEGFGISIYENMNAPLRGLAKYGKEQIGILQEALNSGGFDGLSSAIGGVVADGLTKLADKAPEFINMAASLVESLIDGIDNNAPAIGSSLARLGTSLVTALLRIVPRMVTTGAKLMVEFAKGIVQNLPKIKEAGVQAVEYLMTSAKNALKKYVNFLGDDGVAPFEKILALIPAVIAGFSGFAAIDGVAGGIMGLIKGFKGVGKAGQTLKKGLGGVNSSMSPLAKNILGIGAGLALAASGFMILVNAAKEISATGPGATVALVLMAGGIAALMAVASVLGPELQTCQQGLLAFGGSILMAAAGMSLMAYSATQMAQAGPLALAGISVMVGGMTAMMAIAGSMGAKLAAAAPGLIAFGASILIAGAGMAVMAYAATQLAAAGAPAIAMFIAMAAAVGIFMAVASALAPMLLIGGAGAMMLGAGLLLAGAGMALLVNSAIQLSTAGASAVVALAALAAGILAFGAVAGILTPLLAAGAIGMAAFGAALIVVATGALMGAMALMMIASSLPIIAASGMSGAMAVTMLGTAMLVFGTGAIVAGAGAVAAAAGLIALGAGALAAVPGSVALAASLTLVAAKVSSIASDARSAASALSQMVASVNFVKQGLSTLGTLVTSTKQTLNALFKDTSCFETFKAAFNAMVTAIAAGCARIVSLAVSTASRVRSAFNISLAGSGRNMMQGLINGMNSMSSQVVQTASKIAGDAADAVNKALDVGSPSRLMIRTGEYTGEGLAIGMQNRSADVRMAAQSMTRPVQEESQKMRDMNTPGDYRTSVIDETINGSAGGGNTTNNTDSSSMQINYNPTIVIEGDNVDEDMVKRANKASLDEFEKLMKEWMRKNKRIKFA